MYQPIILKDGENFLDYLDDLATGSEEQFLIEFWNKVFFVKRLE